MDGAFLNGEGPPAKAEVVRIAIRNVLRDPDMQKPGRTPAGPLEFASGLAVLSGSVAVAVSAAGGRIVGVIAISVVAAIVAESAKSISDTEAETHARKAVPETAPVAAAGVTAPEAPSSQPGGSNELPISDDSAGPERADAAGIAESPSPDAAGAGHAGPAQACPAEAAESACAGAAEACAAAMKPAPMKPATKAAAVKSPATEATRIRAHRVESCGCKQCGRYQCQMLQRTTQRVM
jgi:hypothetical protein